MDVNGSRIEDSHYYPFGMAFGAHASVQPYKYNNKELDQMHGLNQYDYSARYYEPAIGRFTTVDPLAELHYDTSPYAYVLNNPLRYIDPLGMDTIQLSSQGQETGRIPARGEDVLTSTLNEVTVSPESSSNTGTSGIFMTGINYLGLGFTTYGGMQYTPTTTWRTGYFKTASGNLYSNNILKPLENGKYVQGIQGIRYGQQYAISRTKMPIRVGSGIGYLTTAYSGYSFWINPNIKDALDSGAGIAGIFFWELGVAYGVGSVYIDCSVNEVHKIQNNITTGRDPLEDVYNPATGQYGRR